MTRKTLVLLMTVLIISLFACETTTAGHGSWGGYGPWYPMYTREYVPYFAMHPPVYYSYPVPRPYGFSPYAYPPGVMTPEILSEPTGPKEIINPHVPPAETTKPTSNQTAQGRSTRGPTPQVMINPFVEPALAAE
jgi:hypothetical protein